MGQAMSPYKLKYRVLSQGIMTVLVDEVFDEYEQALDRVRTLFSDNKYVSIDLLLIGPSCIIGGARDSVLYKHEIFTAVWGS